MALDRTRRYRESWAHAELDRVIAQAQIDGTWSGNSSVLISDPACREQLVAYIRNHIWPAIQRLFQGTELATDTSADNQPVITQEWVSETTMSFMFLIWNTEDLGAEPGDIPYYCRITVKYCPCSYFFNTDFYIHFPESFDMHRLKALLGNSMFVGNPPNLVYETGWKDEPGSLIVEFNSGRGCGHPNKPLAETMLAELAEQINYLRRLIRAVRRLGLDYGNEQHFLQVVHELEKCFPAK
jgi:hypothetical protein